MRNTTELRILNAAIAIAARQGIRRTSLEDVARTAAVSRLTVYRYFDDRRGLISAVCRHVVSLFEEAARGEAAESIRDVDDRLIRLFQRLKDVPYAELGPAFREIDQLYPEIAGEFRQARDRAVDLFLAQAFAAAAREGALKRGLNVAVLTSIFRATLLGLLETPQFVPPGTRLETALATLLDVFRYGALDRSAAVTPIPVSATKSAPRQTGAAG